MPSIAASHHTRPGACSCAEVPAGLRKQDVLLCTKFCTIYPAHHGPAVALEFQLNTSGRVGRQEFAWTVQHVMGIQLAPHLVRGMDPAARHCCCSMGLSLSGWQRGRDHRGRFRLRALRQMHPCTIAPQVHSFDIMSTLRCIAGHVLVLYRRWTRSSTYLPTRAATS